MFPASRKAPSLAWMLLPSTRTVIVLAPGIGLVRKSHAYVPSLAGHLSDVTSVAYAAGGRMLVSGSRDGAVRLWGWPYGKPTTTPRIELTGSVFIDANGNGVRDVNECGVSGVAVSNQDTVVTTDASGTFHISRGRSGIVFVSVPDGYRARGTFWRAMTDSMTSVSFGLTQSGPVREFTFVHASDTHIAPASADRTHRLGALVDSLSPAFLIITGDLVRDALRVSEAEATGYYELFVKETGAFRTPRWTVPGNHENFGIERDKSHVDITNPLYGRAMYHKYLGPDYYSFNYRGVHFIGLNTVDIEDQA